MIDTSHASNIEEPDEQYLSAGTDFLDSQLETADGVEIGRVAGMEAEWREDGSLVLLSLLTGPQILAGRVARPLRTLFRWILRDRFEHNIPITELAKIELTLYLRRNAVEYPTGSADRWIADHILRWIPGSGYKKNDAPQQRQPGVLTPTTREAKARTLLMQELIGSKIVTREGKRVGHVFDLQISKEPDYNVVSLVYGRFALLYRVHVLHPFAHMLHLRGEPQTVSWNRVATVEHSVIVLKDNDHD